MTSDRDGLFAAVLADPDADLPRLVFADWLDEQGEPALAARAGYIRTQIAAEAHAVDSPARLPLNRLAADLKDRFRDEWEEEFRDPGEWFGFEVVRRRGFVAEVGTGPGRLAEVGARMFAAAPVADLWLADPGLDGDAAWAAVGRMPFLARVYRLRVGPGCWALNRAAGPASAALLDCPHLTAVRRLDLSRNGLDDRWAVGFGRRFAAAAFAARLADLDLSANAITDAGASALAAAAGLDGLTAVDLRGNRLTTVGRQVLRARFGDRLRV